MPPVVIGMQRVGVSSDNFTRYSIVDVAGVLFSAYGRIS
jgi:hypothetical protein